MTKKSTELARFRQTCCLGLTSEVLVPRILEELHGIIACDRMDLVWTDESGRVVNTYFEKPDAAALDYLRNNFRQFELDSGFSVHQAIQSGKPTGNFRWPYSPGFEQTESYSRLWQPLHLRYSLDGVLRDSIRAFGQILLFRGENDGDFSASEEQTLAQTLPYITHAIAGPQRVPDAFVESGDSGLVVFDAAGAVTFQSLHAQELCVYALNGSMPAGISLREMDARMGELCDRAMRILDAPDAIADPPMGTIRTVWGEFHLRAYVLQGRGSSERSCGVTIERMIPIEFRMLQKIKQCQLSNRQSEVCYLLLRGVETEQMATMLGITHTTLKDHTRAIYRRMGVARRADLVRLLAK